jgi:hypothetical protein
VARGGKRFGLVRRLHRPVTPRRPADSRACAAAQFSLLDQSPRLYLILNLFGSAILAVLAWYEEHLGFLVLEGVWGAPLLRPSPLTALSLSRGARTASLG